MTRSKTASMALMLGLLTSCAGDEGDPLMIEEPAPRPGDAEEEEAPEVPTVPEEPEEPGEEPAPEEPSSSPTGGVGVADVNLCVELKTAACPGDADAHLTRHGGLRPWAPCRFELVDQDTWELQSIRLAALGKDLPIVGIEGVLGDFDRLASAVDGGVSHLSEVAGLDRAFRWQDVDFHDGAWMPQGISGSFDASEDGLVAGREVVAVSWYHKSSVSGLKDREEVARISFVDVSALGEGGAAPYRHVLLVEPYLDGDRINLRATKVHAGGIAWVGRYLYVADTAKGLRVYDTSQILEVSTAQDRIGYDAQTGEYHAYGYKYALPQVGAYLLSSESCWIRSSFVALDATSSPPSLITGEFHDLDVAGKLARWPLAGERLLASDPARGATAASELFFAQESDVQGALSVGGEWWLSCSAQSGAAGRLYQTSAGAPSVSHGWVVGPEDLMYDRVGGRLWSQNEFAGKRFVFGVDLAGY
jgi:hypothetical protein